MAPRGRSWSSVREPIIFVLLTCLGCAWIGLQALWTSCGDSLDDISVIRGDRRDAELKSVKAELDELRAAHDALIGNMIEADGTKRSQTAQLQLVKDELHRESERLHAEQKTLRDESDRLREENEKLLAEKTQASQGDAAESARLQTENMQLKAENKQLRASTGEAGESARLRKENEQLQESTRKLQEMVGQDHRMMQQALAHPAAAPNAPPEKPQGAHLSMLQDVTKASARVVEIKTAVAELLSSADGASGTELKTYSQQACTCMYVDISVCVCYPLVCCHGSTRSPPCVDPDFNECAPPAVQEVPGRSGQAVQGCSG